MNYFYKISDKNGFVHSIDNVVFCYLLKNYNMEKSFRRIDCHKRFAWEQRLVENELFCF